VHKSFVVFSIYSYNFMYFPYITFYFYIKSSFRNGQSWQRWSDV